MWEWIKNHIPIITALIVGVCLIVYQEGCEPSVKSLLDESRYVTRGELNLELDQIVAKAEFRMIELDKQEKIRDIILQNALVLAAGQPLNPVGIITALAAVYGIGSGVQVVRKRLIVVKDTGVTNSGSG
jgi:hypothetical protein